MWWNLVQIGYTWLCQERKLQDSKFSPLLLLSLIDHIFFYNSDHHNNNHTINNHNINNKRTNNNKWPNNHTKIYQRFVNTFIPIFYFFLWFIYLFIFWHIYENVSKLEVCFFLWSIYLFTFAITKTNAKWVKAITYK